MERRVSRRAGDTDRAARLGVEPGCTAREGRNETIDSVERQASDLDRR